MHAFNKANTPMAVATHLFYCFYCSLGQVSDNLFKLPPNCWKQTPFAHQTPSSSFQNKCILYIKSVPVLNFYCSSYAKGSTQSFCQGHHLCRITCSIIKTLFHEHTLKYAEDVGYFTVACNLQWKQKLHHCPASVTSIL